MVGTHATFTQGFSRLTLASRFITNVKDNALDSADDKSSMPGDIYKSELV